MGVAAIELARRVPVSSAYRERARWVGCPLPHPSGSLRRSGRAVSRRPITALFVGADSEEAEPRLGERDGSTTGSAIDEAGYRRRSPHGTGVDHERERVSQAHDSCRVATLQRAAGRDGFEDAAVLWLDDPAEPPNVSVGERAGRPLLVQGRQTQNASLAVTRSHRIYLSRRRGRELRSEALSSSQRFGCPSPAISAIRRTVRGTRLLLSRRRWR
jgi:hypothetical protein